ncbi:MAG: hypothetical protein K2Y01_02325 [Rhabdochlamydiaceae bacterium]|nr:hypothetical protein [Rhabdochlamydiaceae bacterium]
MAIGLDIQKYGRMGEWVLECPSGNKDNNTYNHLSIQTDGFPYNQLDGLLFGR